MPELPEVESTVRALRSQLLGKKILSCRVRCPQLRYPIPSSTLSAILPQTLILDIQRRAKYILIHTSAPGTVVFHLGMSGSLRVAPSPSSPLLHDHFEIAFTDRSLLRFNDPRRFGAVLWQDDLQPLPFIHRLGVEPLSRNFSTSFLYGRTLSSKRQAACECSKVMRTDLGT